MAGSKAWGPGPARLGRLVHKSAPNLVSGERMAATMKLIIQEGGRRRKKKQTGRKNSKKQKRHCSGDTLSRRSWAGVAVLDLGWGFKVVGCCGLQRLGFGVEWPNAQADSGFGATPATQLPLLQVWRALTGLGALLRPPVDSQDPTFKDSTRLYAHRDPCSENIHRNGTPHNSRANPS